VIASKLLLVLVMREVQYGHFEDLLAGMPSYREITPWLRVDHSKVLLRSGSEWAVVPNAHDATALAGARGVLIDREPGYAIIDERGRERARLPCVSWVSGDGRRIYCVTAAPSGTKTERRTVTLRIWSDEGALVEQRTASLPPADRAGFLCIGQISMVGLLSADKPADEPAIEQVCPPPQSKAPRAPSLNRLFVYRGDKLILLVRAVEYSREPGLGRSAWGRLLPKGFRLLEAGTPYSD
jgi:hypothetical protein